MKIRSNSELSRADAEHLLNGGSVGAPQLEQLLAAASVSNGAPHGVEAALAAFQQAGAPPATRPRRFIAMKTALLAALSSKLVAGTAIAVAATGGVALAASQGAFTTSHAGTHPSSHATQAEASQSPSDQTTPSNSASPSATPSPNLRGLCTAYQAGATSNGGQALNNPAFQALVTAAGGSSNVSGYCTTLLASSHATNHPTGRPTSLPTQANNHATNHPTGRPTSAPTAAPSHPTATSHPSGRPTGSHPGRP